MAYRPIHVIYFDGTWQVRRQGTRKPISTHGLERVAENKARVLAKKEKTELMIHGTDGRIRARDSYGHDPYPPAG